MLLPLQLHLTLPPWVGEVADTRKRYLSDEDRMGLAIELARQNVARSHGGPFGAAVFHEDGRLVAAGVNRVVPQTCSAAHAEMMAYMLAQQRLSSFRLNAEGNGRFILATSAQPCCQCYGATVWAGIDALLIGARSEDVEALTTFDEGPLPADWVAQLERRGIAVRRDILREQACAVLADYGQGGAHY